MDDDEHVAKYRGPNPVRQSVIARLRPPDVFFLCKTCQHPVANWPCLRIYYYLLRWGNWKGLTGFGVALFYTSKSPPTTCFPFYMIRAAFSTFLAFVRCKALSRVEWMVIKSNLNPGHRAASFVRSSSRPAAGHGDKHERRNVFKCHVIRPS